MEVVWHQKRCHDEFFSVHTIELTKRARRSPTVSESAPRGKAEIADPLFEYVPIPLTLCQLFDVGKQHLLGMDIARGQDLDDAAQEGVAVCMPIVIAKSASMAKKVHKTSPQLNHRAAQTQTTGQSVQGDYKLLEQGRHIRPERKTG